jgi:hypothetical protein
MQVGARWRWLRMLVLALMLTAVTPSLEISLSAPTVSVALADDAPDKEDRDKNDKKDNHNKGDDEDQDHVTEGQVIGINTLADPPELTLGAVDGAMLVRVMKTDEIALNGVKLCYYIRIEGEKIHEYLFEATKISVEEKKKC